MTRHHSLFVGMALVTLGPAPSGVAQPPGDKATQCGELVVGKRYHFVPTGREYHDQGSLVEVVAVDGEWVKVKLFGLEPRMVWINLRQVGAIKTTERVKGARAVPDDAPPPLDARLRVRVVAAKLEPSCQFELPGQADQSFENTEYRYAVLDKDGVQVEGALTVQFSLRTVSLPKDKRSVTDATDAVFVKEKLKSGEEYYFVVSVRNLTGHAKFKAP